MLMCTWGPMNVIRRAMHFITYWFSPDSGIWNTPKSPLSSGCSCDWRSATVKRGCPSSYMQMKTAGVQAASTQ